ncbi:tetraacyldisaccharide 4'-kinase [Dyadobacter arcticus]|uniref:Tetraacyldisaccharide 4'-kinase n=1 Tax=Dyadobacter arcticus TaxID=1078754 RepID=A0ABX0UPR6_9BACT|nr:tetraacyldisaccharide 4'-kinase [Dyadobacter arcticus]NIJ53016.1 tetraacyldisaccharide 4'-kinase [Dyadobacter arcticus]
MQEDNWIKTLLKPLSWLYGVLTGLRNQLYDRQVFSSQKVPQFVISVGNLTVGGTGKTPVIEYLTKSFMYRYPTAILSRGYGRNTKGFVLADDAANAATIGDEPLQFYQKFGKTVIVAVCEKRVDGAIEIARLYPHTKLLLLDDAYQHRTIHRNINILLNDYNRPFYHDEPFPGGRLRENRNGAQRADAIIVTKCPVYLTDEEKALVKPSIRNYTRPLTPVFFAFTDYAEALSYTGAPVSLKKVKMVAGIANPSPFAAYLDSRFDVVDKVIFPDHYNYKAGDPEELIKYLKSDTFVVTTEKDMVKLKPLAERSGCADRFAYIPVAINFGDETDAFMQWLSGQIWDQH